MFNFPLLTERTYSKRASYKRQKYKKKNVQGKQSMLKLERGNCSNKNDAQNIASVSFSTKLKNKCLQILGINFFLVQWWT